MSARDLARELSLLANNAKLEPLVRKEAQRLAVAIDAELCRLENALRAGDTFECRANDGRVARVTINREGAAREVLWRLDKTRKLKKPSKVTVGAWPAGAAITGEWVTP